MKRVAPLTTAILAAAVPGAVRAGAATDVQGARS